MAALADAGEHHLPTRQVANDWADEPGWDSPAFAVQHWRALELTSIPSATAAAIRRKEEEAGHALDTSSIMAVMWDMAYIGLPDAIALRAHALIRRLDLRDAESIEVAREAVCEAIAALRRHSEIISLLAARTWFLSWSTAARS